MVSEESTYIYCTETSVLLNLLKSFFNFWFIHCHLCVFRAWSKPWKLHQWQQCHHQPSPDCLSWKSSGRALRTISCERWFSVKTFLIDFQPVLRPRPSPLPFLLLSSSQMSEDRFSSRADTREIQSETALPTTLPRRTDGVSRGQGHPTTAERVLCVLQAALSATHTHLHDGTRPPPWQPTPGSTTTYTQLHKRSTTTHAWGTHLSWARRGSSHGCWCGSIGGNYNVYVGT